MLSLLESILLIVYLYLINCAVLYYAHPSRCGFFTISKAGFDFAGYISGNICELSHSQLALRYTGVVIW